MDYTQKKFKNILT